jgi:hypothetical protein
MSRKVRRMWTALATVAATFGLLTGFVTAAQAAPEYFKLLNAKAVGKCMSVEGGGSTANGANVVIYDCIAVAPEQQWYSTSSVSDGYVYIKNKKSDKCLSVAGGGSTAKGAEIIMWTCNGGPEQRWRFFSEGNSYYRLENFKSKHILSLDNGASTANNTKVIQWSFVTTGDEQIWAYYIV